MAALSCAIVVTGKLNGFFAWLHNFHRVVTHWEYYDDNFFGMVQLACVLILLNRYL